MEQAMLAQAGWRTVRAPYTHRRKKAPVHEVHSELGGCQMSVSLATPIPN